MTYVVAAAAVVDVRRVSMEARTKMPAGLKATCEAGKTMGDNFLRVEIVVVVEGVDY